MGRIKKAAGPKHEATVSPAVSDFVATGVSLHLSRLPEHLRSFPQGWPFPRGDLYHWIPLLNRFDAILEAFANEYGLKSGPQTRPFGRSLLKEGIKTEENEADTTPKSQGELDTFGYGPEGDRELVECILKHSQTLLENCGNRSLYNSSDRLGELLNTTSLSLLSTTLQLSVRLAQRYYTSRQRMSNSSQHLNHALLASHYNIDLEKVQKLTNPIIPPTSSTLSSTSEISTDLNQELPSSNRAPQATNVNDFLSLIQGISPKSSDSNESSRSSQKREWISWATIHLTYYQPSSDIKDEPKLPPTPTPVRRSSGPSGLSRLSNSGEAGDTVTVPESTQSDNAKAGAMKHVDISTEEILSSSPEEILKKYTTGLPKDSAYDLLTRVRTAFAILGSATEREQAVGVRLLAITNLAYIYPDVVFQTKILQPDSEEPRRLQLVHQLTALLNPPGNGESGISPKIQSIALNTLETISKHKSKEADVCAALSINVNHGVLFYVLRKAVAELYVDNQVLDPEVEERREAVFSLVEDLPKPSSNRVGETLVAAGLLEILIEALTLRTKAAQMTFPKILAILHKVIFTPRDGLQTFANAKGLDAISDLIAYEVQSSLENARKGDGLPERFRNKMIDYQIPFHQRETLTKLFRNISSMMQNSSGNFERLLRNFIDSAPLLAGLRITITNAKIFGAAIWSGAVNIMSSFIHNEPTSYAIISEAGLSKSLIEAISGSAVPSTKESKEPHDSNAGEEASSDADPPTNGNSVSSSTARSSNQHDAIAEELAKRISMDREATHVMAQGILPHVEAMLAIPQAFGAICLNHSGMELFLGSIALDRFFEVFESLEHVKALSNNTIDYDTPRILGSAFDELVRHHPNLRAPVIAAVITMIDRVAKVGEIFGNSGCGAKLWVKGEDDQAVPAGARPISSEVTNGHDGDIVMEDATSTAAAPVLGSSHSRDLTDEDKEGSNFSLIVEVAMRFLAGLFENDSICSTFVEHQGAEKLLNIATLPCLPYDYNNQNASQELAKVIHMLAEQKAHLVLPDLLRRGIEATNSLQDLCEYNGTEGFFQQFISPAQHQPNTKASYGTAIAVSLVNVQTLCNILYEVFCPPIVHQTRNSQTPFSQVNLGDLYQKLVRGLGMLHRVCVWEEILLQGRLPESWKEATRIKGYGMGSEEADEVFGFINHDLEEGGESNETPNNASSADTNAATGAAAGTPSKSSWTSKDEGSAQFRNVRTLRYLLSQIPSCIIPFFQGLGKALVNKRRPEIYLRQNAHFVAESISSAMQDQLTFEAPRKSESSKERNAYWIVILTSISQLIVEGSVERPHSQVLTLILQAFKNDGGLDAIREILRAFYDEIKSWPQDNPDINEKATQLNSAFSGIKIILHFYMTITNAKSITESSQSQSISTNERDVGHPYVFSIPQFLVELRLAVLPDITRLWDSPFADTASTPIIKCVIEVLTSILEGADEVGAFTRTAKIPPRRGINHKTYSISPDKTNFLTSKGVEKDLAVEALYRCMSDQNAALEYSQHKWLRPLSMPIPDYDKEKPRRSANSGSHRPDSTPSSEVGLAAQARTSIGRPEVADQDTSDAADGLFMLSRGRHDEIPNNSSNSNGAESGNNDGTHDSSMPPPPAPSAPEGEATASTIHMSVDNLDDIVNLDPEAAAHAQQLLESHLVASQNLPPGPSPSVSLVSSLPNGSGTPVEASSKGGPQTTIDDLNDERSEIKKNLVERVLDVLNVHQSITFELAALISAAALKDPEDSSVRAEIRAEIGETLVQALISFSPATGNEDFRDSGKKIAAYAHLLGIVLQEEKFFQATLNSLKDNIEPLINFIRIFPDQGLDQQSPWISSVLLVLERLLAEDAQPNEITWNPPPPDQPFETITEAISTIESIVSLGAKVQLFESILDIMPRIGKDEALVISVVRILVILTRCRKIADKISDKRNIQRLFVMIKQLSGMTNEMLPGSFMMLLRHIVEDADTIREIMKSELVSNFEMRSNRPMDVSNYIRSMQHLIIRAPELFVEVTNEKCEILKYEAQQPRSQIVTLKSNSKEKSPEPNSVAANDVENHTNDASAETAQTQTSPNEEQKSKVSETKAPVVEHPSGVVHYLLTELLAYKDVDDKEPTLSANTTDDKPSTSLAGFSMTSNGPTISTQGEVSGEPSEERKPEKLEFKPEQYPIYIYRCFILQCLTELLGSYNRIKIEFINFSRKADPKAMTPSKPRSGVLNYLLNDVIPVGNFNHEDSNGYRKRNNTSNWAISVIVSLCLRTNEAGYEKKPGSIAEDDQHDLLFVRKFVLEHALKAYKDASALEEHPDTKYARILDLADLFQRLLTGKLIAHTGPTSQTTEYGIQHSIAKLMYEKNFIAALTSSIADIDLNYPGSKRAVKYILRPLKQLTATAIKLSQESLISTAPGTTEEDEISTASSVSNVGAEREETPDLFRNSTLEMYEPERDEDSQSGSSEEEDEDMYDDEEEEGEGMDYEDEIERDPDEVISDEEEEVEGMGHMEGLHGDAGMDVEVVINGDDDDDNEDDDDDDDEDDEEDPDDSEDEMDEDDDVEVIDEIAGDDENVSLAEGGDVDWEDDMEEVEDVDNGGEFEVDVDNGESGAETAVRNIIQEFGGGGPIRAGSVFNHGEQDIQALEEELPQLRALEDGPADLQMDIESGRYMDDVVRRQEEEEEDDDEEDQNVDEDEEEVLYNPSYDDDERGMPDPPWGFEPDDDPFVNDMHHHHHHHHHHRQMPRRFQDAWSPFPGGTHGIRSGVPLYRSHRPVANAAAPNDDGANPLLRRNDHDNADLSRGNRAGISDAAASLSDYWVHGMEMGQRNVTSENPVSFVNSIIAAIGNGTTIPPIGGNAPIHIQFGGGSFTGRSAITASQRDLPRELQTLLGGTRHIHHHEPTHLNHHDQTHHAVILPQSTFRRWQEESRLLFSASVYEKAHRVSNSILRLLVPPAFERRLQEIETTKLLKEQQDKLREEERQAKEKAEKEEREKREKEQREAEERAEREAQETASRTQADRETAAADIALEATNAGEDSDEGAMEGVESTHGERSIPEAAEDQTRGAEAGEGEPSRPTERIMTRLGDREIDITGLGIDLAYLDALPEDIRQEVLMSQIAIQRSQAAEAGQPPTEISGEFLEALPPEIREELLQHEAADRRRRARQEAQRQAAAAGGSGSRAEDMDPASFLASLDPTLRQNVLMEQDEDMLAHLPAEIAAEARALGGDRGMHGFAGIAGRGPRLARQVIDAQRVARHTRSPIKKPQRKQIVQMLDKAGVASLLRLMFIPQHGSSRDSFNSVLRNISENRQNRAEVISLLLSILQDGSIDVNAVERSFSQLSVRAKQPKDQKTPQPVKRTSTGTLSGIANSVEATPLTIIQQCLSTLVALTQHNPHIPSFFLTEHDLSSGIKSKSSRKGKGKENKAQRYPLNALLRLIDRKLIMESSGCLEQLANLLQSVTHPLNMLLKKEKEEERLGEQKSAETSSTQENNEAPVAASNEQPDQSAQQSSEVATASPMAGVQTTSAISQPNGAQAAENANASTDEAKIEGTNEKQKDEDKQAKKPRALSPPIVPEENLRLVVNIIAARECSKRTFQQSVATISNLKAIPGAKEIFGKGLIEQAQDLGKSILEDLDGLLPQIKEAQSGTDVQGLALTKFATASSDQSKLLRVLTALDYLFGPKTSINNSTPDKDKDVEARTDLDLLTSLYENSTFGPLWEKLSECLSAVRQGEGMLNIASILQPLIEALMVVCKNTTLKDSTFVKAQKEFSITSPAPESRMESLFFKFTEEHRKILNELVRHSPRLMMGTFSLLVKNPKVLEFDNKRSYFTKRLHSRGTEARHPQPPLQLSVRRDQVFLDSFKFLSFKSGDEIKYGKLSIRFHGEEGVDAGGVTREWFQVLSRQMFNPDYALFIPVASDRTTFHPNKLSKVNEEHLMFFKFIGRIIGKALYEGRALDCHFSRAVYKRILGKTVSIKDMETLDLDYYKSLLWMLENDITDLITETFSVETDDFGVTEIVDLIENGRNIPVTEENKQEYVQLVVEYRLTGSVQTQLAKFLGGFHDIVSPELISIFNEQELELLISGLPDIDVDDWKTHTEYHNYQAASPQIQWFWRAVRSFDKEERAKLLQFVTGTSKVPLNGFGQLEGMNGFSRFNIHRDYGNKDRLPSSHTCFNQLDLPEYDSYEALRSHVYTAMTAGSEYFGFA